MNTPERLLVVDDEVTLTRMLFRFFRARGFETFTALSLREGIERYRETRPAFVICDVHLPDGSGLDLLREVRSLDPDVYVIMITAYDDMDTTVASPLGSKVSASMMPGSVTFMSHPARFSASAPMSTGRHTRALVIMSITPFRTGRGGGRTGGAPCPSGLHAGRSRRPGWRSAG